MSKFIILIGLGLFCAIPMFAQTALKLNMHSQFEPFENSQFYDDGSTETDNGFDLSILPSPTISFYKENGNFHEIGLSRIQFSVDEDKTTRFSNGNYVIINGVKETSLNICLRYDYNYAITNNEKAMVGYLGISASPSYNSIIIDPHVNSSYKGKYITAYAAFGFVPRFIWKLNQSIYVDLNIPINLYQITYNRTRIFNSSLSVKDQSWDHFESIFLPKNYEVRLGVGIIL